VKLQGLSFARFFRDDVSVNRIHVLWNERDHDMIGDEFEQAIKPAYGRLQHKVNLMFVTDLFPIQESSWNGQQIAKLIVARVVTSRYYVVFDAKNHFIRPTGVDAFITDGKPVMQISYQGPDVSFRCCRHYFGSDDDTLEKIAPDLATPFVFERRHVLALIERIEAKHHCTFYKAFAEPIAWTCYEFSAYTTYLLLTQNYHNDTHHRAHDQRVFMSTFRGSYYPENAGTVSFVKFTPPYSIFGLHSQLRMDKASMKDLVDFYTDVSGIEFARQVQGTFFAMHHGYNAGHG
jgi:hypothetical protein